jgi:two-component system, OmpR family, phosphate regulon sensor histidine kinase PhoR
MMTDITAQKQVQAERERLLAEVEGARQNLQTILNRLPEAVLVVDRERRVRIANDTVRRYLGRDVLGAAIPELRVVYDLSLVGTQGTSQDLPLERALRGQVVSGVQVSVRLADGRRLDALESAAPLYGADGEVDEAAVLLTDITPLKELDRAKDEFISIAAHDLRTPLTSIKGHAQILQRRMAQGACRPEVRRSLQTIDEQVNRMSDLISRLLDVSRIRLGRLELRREPVDLVSLARQAVEDLRITAGKHEITFNTELPALVGQWDPTALGQVLANLVGNAIKHTPGGRITVHVSQQDNLARVDVTDQGPGIPPERQAHLFEAFAPGAAEEYRRAGGLGLGLYITRGIIEAYGGRVWLESVPSKGTTASFVLPI